MWMFICTETLRNSNRWHLVPTTKKQTVVSCGSLISINSKRRSRFLNKRLNSEKTLRVHKILSPRFFPKNNHNKHKHINIMPDKISWSLKNPISTKTTKRMILLVALLMLTHSLRPNLRSTLQYYITVHIFYNLDCDHVSNSGYWVTSPKITLKNINQKEIKKWSKECTWIRTV